MVLWLIISGRRIQIGTAISRFLRLSGIEFLPGFFDWPDLFLEMGVNSTRYWTSICGD